MVAKSGKPVARSRARLATLASVLALAAPACAAEALPPGFVRLSKVAPGIVQDIRYATANNFTGHPVPGYSVPECWLRREAAEALAEVARDLAATGWTLVVYDCYRPKRAVAAFVAWAQNPGEQSRKPDFYPAIDKRSLFALGYIARASAHSTGLAVDAGAIERTPGGSPDPDFGTPFDRFDPRSATASNDIPEQAQSNRKRLAAAFSTHGFAPYAREWWHFTFTIAGKAPAFDLPLAP